ncbi:hypothetical protein [Alteromonas macleodii]|nr:hypothetical protein [Alteromonas macleodii]
MVCPIVLFFLSTFPLDVLATDDVKVSVSLIEKLIVYLPYDVDS